MSAVLLRCCEGAGVAGAELCLSVVVRPWSSPFGCVCQCLGSVRGRVALGDDGPVAKVFYCAPSCAFGRVVLWRLFCTIGLWPRRQAELTTHKDADKRKVDAGLVTLKRSVALVPACHSRVPVASGSYLLL